MAKQANRMMIGGFVVIAVFLLAASIVIFGSGKFFKKTDRYVLHFDGSIKGLSVGAPVLVQGVQIGSVTGIMLRTSRETLSMDIPVFIDIEPDRFQVVDKQVVERDPKKTLPLLVDKGLRAVLTMQSLITGQLMIELDYYPGTPVNLKETDSGYLEIPTIKSTSERLYQTLQEVDFKAMATHLEDTMEGIDTFVNNPDWGDGLHSLKVAADELRDTIANFDSKIGPVLDNFDNTITDSRKLINNVDLQVEPLAGELTKVLDDIDSLIQNAKTSLKSVSTSLEKTLTGLEEGLSVDGPLIIRMENTLQDISAMASSMRQLADYLEQHPEALLQGKKEYGGK